MLLLVAVVFVVALVLVVVAFFTDTVSVAVVFGALSVCT